MRGITLKENSTLLHSTPGEEGKKIENGSSVKNSWRLSTRQFFNFTGFKCALALGN